MRLHCNLLVYSYEFFPYQHLTTFVIIVLWFSRWMHHIYFNSTIFRHLVNFQCLAINKAMNNCWARDMMVGHYFCRCIYCCCSVFPSGVFTTFMMLKYKRGMRRGMWLYGIQYRVAVIGGGGNKTYIKKNMFIIFSIIVLKIT